MESATIDMDGLVNDAVTVSSTGSCITITAKNYMSWWRIFAKYYHDTYCEEDSKSVDVHWKDEKDKHDNITETTIKYSNSSKKVNIEFHVKMYASGKINIQGKKMMVDKWYKNHYPCIVHGKGIEGITDRNPPAPAENKTSSAYSSMQDEEDFVPKPVEVTTPTKLSEGVETEPRTKTFQPVDIATPTKSDTKLKVLLPRLNENHQKETQG